MPVTVPHEITAGLDCLNEVIDEVRRSHPRLETAMLARNLVEPGTGIVTLCELSVRYHTAVFETVITRRDEIAACRARHLPVQLHAPGSEGAALFARLADEVLREVNQSPPAHASRSEP